MCWPELGWARPMKRRKGSCWVKPDVGRLGEGTLAPGMFRRFRGFGGVKAAEIDTEKQNMIKIVTIYI